MAEYNGQMGQQYSMDVGHSSTALQRMHPSTQQQQHILQNGQMIAQKQIMMQPTQQIHMSPCSGKSLQLHHMPAQMGPPQMMSQQGVTLMNQPVQMQQPIVAQSTMMQSQHHMIAAGQISPQQSQQQIVVTSMAQQQMINTVGPQIQQPHQLGRPAQQVPHQLGPQAQQVPPHQIMASTTQIMQNSPQTQHGMTSQQSIGPNSGFAHPNPHMHIPVSNYQQASPLRPAVNRYPSSSPENVPHASSLYRPPVQRVVATARVIGQSPAIRQALGHIPSAPMTHAALNASDYSVSQNNKLVEKDAMEAFIKTVDPLEVVEDDVSDALMQLTEEFVDGIIDQIALVAKHRSAPRMETKDVQYILERRYQIYLPAQVVIGGHSLERTSYTKSPITEAHRQRMSMIKKVVQKP